VSIFCPDHRMDGVHFTLPARKAMTGLYSCFSRLGLV